MNLQEELSKWHKFRIWGVTDDDKDVCNAVMAYMIRCLSKGYVPSREIVEKTLSREKSIPKCRFLACCLPDDGEHVH